ncbi:MAG: hypothetical protein ACTSRX_11795, partial [Promethearchaeota archaeon]
SLDIINLLEKENIKISKIGQVIAEKEIYFESESKKKKILPRFRESAYTEIKKVVELQQLDEDQIKLKIHSAFLESLEKRNKIVKFIQNSKI